MPVTRKWEPTQRDIAIIRAVHRFKLLGSRDHILPLFDGNKRVLRRLETLTKRGYLFRLNRRPHEQAIYTPGNCGLVLLRDRFGVPIPKNPRQPDQARRLKIRFIEHTLDIASVIIAIELACRARPDVRFLSQEQIISGAPQRTRAEARKLRGRPLYIETYVMYEGERSRQGTEADWLFGLHPKGKDPKYFFLEVDRGTESVMTPDLNKASIIKKQLVYLYASGVKKLTSARAQKGQPSIYEQQFGTRNIRTLFAVSGRYSDGRERVKNFIGANKYLTRDQREKGTRLFLFTEQSHFLSAPDVLEHSLTSGKDDPIALID